MKDTTKPCHHTLSEDIIFKEVVIIGNGPSGLVTSYMLAGNVPHLKEVPKDLPIDDMLRARLSNLPVGVSLYDVDLTELAEGLEGRSQNPMPILMDTLLRPCADLGMQADSLIEWKFDIEKQIEHIVLGRGPPGGSWHNFPPSLRALSPSPWLSLPPLVCNATDNSERMTAKEMAAYCLRYVAACRLQRYFRSGVIVNSVTRVAPSIVCQTRNCPLKARFCVCGYEKSTGAVFRYYCNRVVVSCGGADRQNTLQIHMPSAITHLHVIEDTVQKLRDKSTSILVVGSGVSAADAVIISRSVGLHVYHAHRTPAPALAKLNKTMYPDYYQVHKMMTDDTTEAYTNYTSLQDHIIIEMIEEKTNTEKHIKLLNLQNNEMRTITVSLVAVLIGSKPDLHFLQNYDYLINCKCEKEEPRCFLRNHWHYLKCVIDKGIQSCKAKYLNYSEINENNNNNNNKIEYMNPFSDGIGFGIDEKKPVDCRSNPLAIDKGTHEMLHSPKGMYALGPVTADNFVRFIPGGALAIASHMHKERKNNE